jgi:hypothetical protein
LIQSRKGEQLMKKFTLLSFVLVAALLLVGTVGYAYAQTSDPNTAAETATCPMGGPGAGSFGGMMRGRGMMGEGFGRGMMGEGFGRGMMGSGPLAGQQGAMHEYFQAALAGKLGLTAEQLAERIEAGESAWLIAEAQGLTLAEYRQMLTEAHIEGLAQAVEDGVLTQAQADQMQSHMQSRFERGFGPGSGMGRGFRGGNN